MEEWYGGDLPIDLQLIMVFEEDGVFFSWPTGAITHLLPDLLDRPGSVWEEQPDQEEEAVWTPESLLNYTNAAAQPDSGSPPPFQGTGHRLQDAAQTTVVPPPAPAPEQTPPPPALEASAEVISPGLTLQQHNEFKRLSELVAAAASAQSPQPPPTAPAAQPAAQPPAAQPEAHPAAQEPVLPAPPPSPWQGIIAVPLTQEVDAFIDELLRGRPSEFPSV